MEINYPKLIGNREIDLKFTIGDKVKHKKYGFEFVISSINISPNTGKHYRGIGIVEDEEGLTFGKEDNLELIKANVFQDLELLKEK